MASFKDKGIKLLEKQISKLEDKEFDLEAWKSSTIHLLTILFAAEDPKVKEIFSLKIDYSSWALRDSGADYKPLESCKKKGKEILEIAKSELVLLGDQRGNMQLDKKLKEVLTEDQYAKFTGASSSETDRKIVLKSLTKEALIGLIAGVKQ